MGKNIELFNVLTHIYSREQKPSDIDLSDFSLRLINPDEVFTTEEWARSQSQAKLMREQINKLLALPVTRAHQPLRYQLTKEDGLIKLVTAALNPECDQFPSEGEGFIYYASSLTVKILSQKGSILLILPEIIERGLIRILENGKFELCGKSDNSLYPIREANPRDIRQFSQVSELLYEQLTPFIAPSIISQLRRSRGHPYFSIRRYP